ncbi:MAG: hypothetical protein PVH84_00065 [Candidatus Aminicenantes bacterium]|jgi:hypothetical protein
MKKTLVLGLLSIGLFFPSIRAHSDNIRTETPVLPPQISEFYKSYNFISSFSTGAERKMLIEKYSRYGIPEDMETERLGKVFNRMKRLEDWFFVMDSEMVIWVGPTPKFWKFHFRPVLFDVLGIHFSGDMAVVDVVSYHVEPETILRFISAFEESDGDEQKVPSPDERILHAKSSDPEKIFHRWVLQNGKWKKSTADLYPLKDKRY